MAQQEAPRTAAGGNGPVLLRVPADPTVAFSVQFAVGCADDPPGKEGLAFLTAQMLADAATRRNGYAEVLEKLYPLAADYSIRVDREATTLTGRTHRDNLDAYVPLFLDALLEPAFAEQDFQRVRHDAVNYLENTLRYSSDEELAKAALYRFVFEGTRYAHPAEGTVAGLTAVTLADVRDFYRRRFTRRTAQLGLGGGFDDALVARMAAALGRLPAGDPPPHAAVAAPPIAGRQVLIVEKPGADTSLSFGFPLDVLRGERDFYALWIANSWLGEHRNQASHLFQVIREVRGLNYGDYSYIEAFPEGGERQMPPVNVPRRQQLFEVWIRTLPNNQALFALRAALHELQRLVDDGLTQEQFELTRAFLSKYVLHFAETTSARLGYAMDDRFYGLDGEGHLARFRRVLSELTAHNVNTAVTKHLQYANLKIAIVTGAAEALAAALAADAPSPIVYSNPKPQSVLDDDKTFATYPLDVAGRIAVEPAAAIFQQ